MSAEPLPTLPPSASAPQTSGLAIASLISGVADWIVLPFIGAIVAIITGHLAKREIDASMGRLTGGGMATAGLILGYVQLVLVAAPLCIICLLALMGPAIGEVSSDILVNI